jgi:hypothetical protein
MPVVKEAEPTQIELGIFVEIKSMECPAETRFQVAQKDVDPAKRGEIIGVSPAGYHSSGAQPAATTERKQARPSERTEQILERCCRTQSASASDVNPVTEEILAEVGFPATFKEMAATFDTLISEPRPALPPVRSPLK